MTKANVTTSQLLDWAKYDQQAKQSPEAAISAIYKHAKETVDQLKTWYWNSIKTKKRTCLFTRTATFVLLFAGTILPVMIGTDSSADAAKDHVFQLQLGVASLALAGLIQVADKVFGWSSGWVRYIAVVTLLESLSTRFEMDWSGFILASPNALDTNDVAQLFSVAKKFVEDSLKLQGDETDKWVTEFNNGSIALADAIRAGRDVADKSIETVKTAITSVEQTGGLQITITRTTATDEVEVNLDGKVSERVIGQSWAASNVPIGVRLIRVHNLSTEAKSVVRALIVLPNAVTADTVTV